MRQILNADYDTQASFYCTKAGSEPVHVQLTLVTGEVDAVNTTPQARLSVEAALRLLSAGGRRAAPGAKSGR